MPTRIPTREILVLVCPIGIVPDKRKGFTTIVPNANALVVLKATPVHLTSIMLIQHKKRSGSLKC
jgi:hypothetical protein